MFTGPLRELDPPIPLGALFDARGGDSPHERLIVRARGDGSGADCAQLSHDGRGTSIEMGTLLNENTPLLQEFIRDR